MIMKPLPFESPNNKMPFYPTKGFSQIKFKEKGFLIPGFKIETMYDLLSNYDVRSNVSPLNKSSLGRVNNMRGDVFLFYQLKI